MSAPLRQALEQFPAILITGPRQSGKSTFLLHELGEEAHYLSFDDPLERDFARLDPNGFLDRFPDGRVILDEIQYVPEILPYLKLRIDRERQRYGRWVLTGSQRFQLMAGVSESLAGRVAILELLPFSLSETAKARAGDLPSLVWNGSYPEPALEPGKRDLWLRSYLETYVERDIRQLQNVRDFRAFEAFIGLCAARHGQLLNFSHLARDAGISQPTAKSWLGLLEAAYVVRLLRPHHRNYGKRVTRSPKLFFLDSGLACHLTRQPAPEAALAGAMGGALFEGPLVAEAVKSFAERGRVAELSFWRSHDGLEVDLLVQGGGVLHPVEFKLTATPSARHGASLERFKTLVGSEGATEGVLVCRIADPRPLPGGNRAIPWQRFPEWVARIST